MLLSLLDAGITRNFVRLGSRSSNERISEYTLDKLEKVAQGKPANRAIGKTFAEMKKLEEKMISVLERIQIPEPRWENIEEHLGDFHPQQLESLLQPPYWIQALLDQMFRNADDGEEWEVVHRSRRRPGDKHLANTPYGSWKNGYDIQFITPPSPPSMSEKPVGRLEKRKEARLREQYKEDLASHQQRTTNFFGELGYAPGSLPPIPDGRRSTSELLSISNIWSLSLSERRALAESWEAEIRSVAYNEFLGEYDSLRDEYDAACKKYNDVRDENRRRLLSRVDLIGCTTNGAAKLTSLLTTLAPKVLIVEEAGQVLEAHILASLVPS
ncbi:hypothetical protein V5O48_019240, partial [Marasmius crinis-equi]